MSLEEREERTFLFWFFMRTPPSNYFDKDECTDACTEHTLGQRTNERTNLRRRTFTIRGEGTTER